MGKSSKEALVITDLHLRDDIHPKYLDKQIETLLRLISQKKYDYILILGDIFEFRTSKSIVLLKFKEFLQSIPQGKVIILRGNHDTVYKTDTTLSIQSLFDSYAKIITDVEDIKIHHTVCRFIPHFESDYKLEEHIKSAKNVIFGHFGFNGAVGSLGHRYTSGLPKSLFKVPTFLGHIHKARKYDNIHVIGTQYTTNFGEANQKKYFYEMTFHNNGSFDAYKKEITFGIKHISASLNTLKQIYNKYANGDFFKLIRVKVDNLHTFNEDVIREQLEKNYKYDVLDVRFDDIINKHSSRFATDKKLFQLNEGIMQEYIEQNETDFSKDELEKILKEIYEDNETDC
jgi:DNA repair exonuclease SbcCD nuclease subunit